MWKAEYVRMGPGAEIEFLYQNVPLKKAGPLWHADPNDPNLPKMTESLSYKGTETASFAPQIAQVWVGSYNQNAGSWNPNTADVLVRNMHLKATVTFPDPGMLEAFRTSDQVVADNWHFHGNTASINK